MNVHDVSIVTPHDGEVIDLGPIRMRILEDGSTTGHRLAIGEVTLAPRSKGPTLHRHALHDEGFYIISGTARFTVEEREYDAARGTLVVVPPGVPHTFANPGDEPVVMLTTFSPDVFVQYFRDIRDALTSGQELTEQANRYLMSRYATTPATEHT
ncbi:cupin domain-containing protein [Streptantibioticus rubrisoli]|uniref:Cupin domain-containing protein n=1 Tax=Streptantibioticus rubrisoli TaxID=1387313 RepID=A0ABT1P9Z4_9ACTN|nr:cupin domain-containing protein [Streptantibioticus rubrisoli]MCQ4041253.1 cupin domain-containing protein [Streptantibioticus rubrisoli]